MLPNEVAELKALTRSDVHIKGALGDAHASKSYGNDMSASLARPVGAAINAVAFVLHHDFHAVLAALWISDHGSHVSRSSSYKHRITFKDLKPQNNLSNLSHILIFSLSCYLYAIDLPG